MIVANKTHYFNEYTKVYNVVPDPLSFGFQSSKRLGYYQRLFFEFEYTKKVGGVCFYYTLTYNNASIPLFRGHNVFNYDHIRLVTNGLISKRLKREYGSRLKYFCACESGEGKGVRGLGNNPHYHFIFFVQPLHDSDDKPVYDKFKLVSSQDFLYMLQDVWCGHRGWYPWQMCRFGSVKAGKFGDVVVDSRAFKYVSKYVIKDNDQLSFENEVRGIYFSEALGLLYSASSFLRYYYYLKSIKFDFDKYKFFTLFGFNDYYFFRKRIRNLTYEEWVYSVASDWIKKVNIDYKDWFREVYCSSYADSKMSDFKNQYSGKCRLSKSLGLYGLNFIQDIDSNPKIKIIEKSGPVLYNPCLFYLRHLYYDVKICPFTGNPLYVLSPLGKELKLNQLNSRLSSFYHRVLDNVSVFLDNDLSFLYKYDSFDTRSFCLSLRSRSDFMRLIYIYSVYHKIYQYRSYTPSFPCALTSDFKIEHIKEDYSLFLQYDMSFLDFDSGCVYSLNIPNRISFSSHPLFEPYIKFFDFLDSLNDYVDRFVSSIKMQEFNDILSHQKKLNAFQFNCSLY